MPVELKIEPWQNWPRSHVCDVSQRSVSLYRFTWAFAARLCDGYRNRLKDIEKSRLNRPVRHWVHRVTRATKLTPLLFLYVETSWEWRLKNQSVSPLLQNISSLAGVDLGFLERGFLCIKVWGSLCWFYLIILTETKLFHFHRIFKKWAAWRGVRANPLWISHWLATPTHWTPSRSATGSLPLLSAVQLDTDCLISQTFKSKNYCNSFLQSVTPGTLYTWVKDQNFQKPEL